MHFKTFIIIALCVAFTIAQDSGEAATEANASDVVASDETGSSEAKADNAEPEVEQLPENADADGDDTSENAQEDDAEPENEEPSEDEATNDDATDDETAESAEPSNNADESSNNDASESAEPEANESSENTAAESQEAASQETVSTEAANEEAASQESTSQEAASQEAASQDATSQEAASQEASENSNETTENGSSEGSDVDSNESESGSTEAPEFSCESVGRFENPDSCEKYYFCWDSDMQYAVFSCPHRQAFDPLTKICGHDFSVCSSAPKCTMNKQIFPDPDDKLAYYECKLHSDGLIAYFELRKEECGKGREFDEEAGLCKKPDEDEEASSEKGKKGKFKCNEVGIYIDIEDETKFYECLVKNVAKGEMKTVHRKCPKFHVFSLADNRCVLLYP